MSTTSPRITARQLEQNPPAGRWELIRGEVRTMSPAGAEHGWIAANLAVIVGGYVRQQKLGRIFGAETGFLIERDPDTVRAPDFAFVSGTESNRPGSGYFPGAPDLAVEVLSPHDRSSDVTAKSEQWLRAGCQAVWLIDPVRETAAVCTLEDDLYVMRAVTELSHADLLPGFSVPVGELFRQV